MLSIIIPCFNVEDYIIRCLNSITAQQSVNEVEIIIINDGSTDQTEFLVANYMRQHTNITYFKQQNQGLSAARNQGLNLASGSHIWFIDADDYISEGSISNVINYIKNHDDADVFSMGFVHNGKVRGLEYKGGECYSGYDFIHLNPFFYAPTFIYKKDFLNLNNLRFGNFRNIEDYHFNLRVFFYANKIYHIEKLQYYYYQRPGSISMTRSRSHLELLSRECVKVAKSLKIFLDKNTHQISNLPFYQLIYECVNALCFSWIKFNYDYRFMSSQMDELSQARLYPSQTTRNKRSNLFAQFSNKKFLFLFVQFIRNTLFAKYK